MRVRTSLIAAACLVGGLVAAPRAMYEFQSRTGARPITWDDTGPLHARLEAHGITGSSFAAYVEQVRTANARRVRAGDLDHLVFYLLQSSHFTSQPAAEPALSAKALVDSLEEKERDVFLRTGDVASSHVPASVRSRLSALLRALDSQDRDPRIVYFRELVRAAIPPRGQREAALVREYARVMRFLYEKEFVAQRAGAAAVADLYRTRGLSTDTAVEAGYLVYLGLGVAQSLGPEWRPRRVLIIGPGLDLAPRTGLVEAGPPESYQPWAVMDALVDLGLSRPPDLEIVAADINPRVVSHLRRAHTTPPALTLVSEIQDSDTVTLSAEYREYFSRLGRAIGEVEEAPEPAAHGRSDAGSPAPARLRKTVRVAPTAARSLAAEPLDIVTGRLNGTFDLVIATNILPYFDDVQLMLAMSNIAGMLAPGGVFLHNEARPMLNGVSAALGLPFEQSRHVVIATVRGAQAPLFDSVWLHRKSGR